MPWAAAAVYWSLYGSQNEDAWRSRYRGEEWYTRQTPVGFAVPAGDLAYSVQVFCAASILCLATLILRRSVLGFELGGPPVSKWLTFAFFVALWFGYIYLSIAKSQGGTSPPMPSGGGWFG